MTHHPMSMPTRASGGPGRGADAAASPAWSTATGGGLRAVLPALCTALLALALVLAPAAPAAAHDELLRSNPEAGATLEKAPTTLELTFSGEIQDIGGEIRVTDSRGTDVTRGTLAVQNTKVSQPLREGGDTDETYTVTWRVVSQDGHPIEGTYTYMVGEGAGTTASPAPVASGSQDSAAESGEETVTGTGIPSWVLPVIGGVLALILLLVILVFATRPKQR